ncbi:methionyl-tRNA formyltransferase, mitochondrial [Trematomus bernacchii]|uniref:methionyl-tRNA formyltransferase, mitochondrial n=1 Tax=Trematomus bernacchii TaxID=40690 RepID=UPI00146E18EB|nr:methionyl-tRNA formyltransferase, mitochondrial [Trematomus bernacchii]
MWLLGRTAALRCLRAGGRPAARRLSPPDPPGAAVLRLRPLRCGVSERAPVKGGVVETLEVVVSAGGRPVKRFRSTNQLPSTAGPPLSVDGQFDVGGGVSFGCLLPEKLINNGILNVHPSLLPRWRGPAPIFHTIMHGDAVTGVSIIQIRPHRFDVGPLLQQERHQVPEGCTADQLEAALSSKGAHLLVDTLRTLSERIAHKREQSQSGGTFDERSRAAPGSVSYQKESDTLAVSCKDGWVGFRSVVLKKRLTAGDFYNGYLHQTLHRKSACDITRALFITRKHGGDAKDMSENSTS